MTSQCLLCAEFHYDQELRVCPRCGGACAVYPEGALEMMARQERAAQRLKVIPKGDLVTSREWVRAIRGAG